MTPEKKAVTKVKKMIGPNGGVLSIGGHKVLIQKRSLDQAYEFILEAGKGEISLRTQDMEVNKKMDHPINPEGILFQKPVMVQIAYGSKKDLHLLNIVRGSGSAIDTSVDEDGKVLYGYTTQLGDFAIK